MADNIWNVVKIPFVLAFNIAIVTMMILIIVAVDIELYYLIKYLIKGDL